MNKWLLAVPVAGALGIGFGVGVNQWLGAAPEAKQDLKPATTLPLTRVVLFNSGVGYFSRSGEVEGDARVDLMFPEADINDLLKSMVLEDFSKDGRISAVSYDSREPITRTLSSFAINLNGNPTFAGIVSQMRGERIEAVVSATAANQPGKLTGTIVGVERRRVPAGATTVDVEVLNMWCAEGMRAVKMSDIQSLRFSNPIIESEFRRALEVLAQAHDAQKKAVQVHFAGEGKRKVQVGYVIEAPIWKTSYRLLMSEKEKPYLQGWAMVENPTDEDWSGVKMALVSGRPISFKMDLYNPLYIDRPTVEPELFASLRPVTYRGDMDNRQMFNFSVGLFGNDGGEARNPELAALVRRYQELLKKSDYAAAERVALQAKQLYPDDPAVGTLYEAAKLGRRVKEAEQAKSDREQLFLSGLNDAEKQGPLVTTDDPVAVKLLAMQRANLRGSGDATYRRNTAAELAARINTGGVGNAATAAALGDFYQYTIDHPVTLPRQKSAMLPIVGKAIEGARVSIYNPAVQAKHPLLGLRFKNTSGAHLNQGPITVFEGSVYAGDTRVLDVQPNEERLLSYAIDLGTEVDPKAGAGAQKITSIKAVKGIVTTATKVMEETTYKIVNRSQTDRTLLIEHPNRTAQQFKFVDTEKPVEDTPEVFRFQTTVKAGETKSFTVKEERDGTSTIALTNGVEDQIRYFISLSEASPALKKNLEAALKIKSEWDATLRELNHVATDLQRLSTDQDRIRKNLRDTPKEAEVYATYLKKLSEQEKDIDTLTAKQKTLMADEFAARKKYEGFLANIGE